MEEYAILNLDHLRIEKILFEYYFKDYKLIPKQPEQNENE